MKAFDCGDLVIVIKQNNDCVNSPYGNPYLKIGMVKGFSIKDNQFFYEVEYPTVENFMKYITEEIRQDYLVRIGTDHAR